MIFNEQPKSQPISKLQVQEAFKRVKANKGASGVDGVTIEAVTKTLANIYTLCGIEWQVGVTTPKQSDKF